MKMKMAFKYSKQRTMTTTTTSSPSKPLHPANTHLPNLKGMNRNMLSSSSTQNYATRMSPHYIIHSPNTGCSACGGGG